jgi:hypothetical protein
MPVDITRLFEDERIELTQLRPVSETHGLGTLASRILATPPSPDKSRRRGVDTVSAGNCAEPNLP